MWALLLMPSGEAKSPLLKRLLEEPWRLAVDPVLTDAHERRVAEWDAQRQGQEPGSLPKPRKPQTLVTEDATIQGMETHLEIHDAWANRSMCVWLDEGKQALKQMVDRNGGNGKDSPFGGWLLSRYDGTGARGAKADLMRERNYKSSRLSMVTCCQPDVYRAITGDGDQTGLSARVAVAIGCQRSRCLARGSSFGLIRPLFRSGRVRSSQLSGRGSRNSLLESRSLVSAISRNQRRRCSRCTRSRTR